MIGILFLTLLMLLRADKMAWERSLTPLTWAFRAEEPSHLPLQGKKATHFHASPGTGGEMRAIQQDRHCEALFFEKTLDGASKDFGYTIERLDTCLVDILVPLLIHLDGAQADT